MQSLLRGVPARPPKRQPMRRPTRARAARIAASQTDVARRPEKYAPMEVIELLFPEQVDMMKDAVGVNRKDWEEHRSLSGYGCFTGFFTVPGTDDETYAYTFNTDKGVTTLEQRHTREASAAMLEEERRDEEEFEARPSRRCDMCGEMKRDFKASGGCMDCPVPLRQF